MNQSYVISQRTIFVLTEQGIVNQGYVITQRTIFLLTESGYSEPRLCDYSGNYFSFDRVRV